MGLLELLRRSAYFAGLTIIASSLSLLGSGAYGLYLYAVAGDIREEYAALVMLGFGAAYIIVGALLTRLGTGSLRPSEAVAATVLIWLSVPLLDAVPFMVAAGIPFIDAFFESVSGWTTTGLTILTGEASSWNAAYVPYVEELPATLQAWRTLMQWEGGLGIVVFTIALLAPPGVSVATLYLAEGKFEKLEASFRKSAVKMGLIYLVLTAISIVLFYGAGMPFGDAVHHAMTGIATAGFSTHTDSLGYYIDMPGVLVAGMIVMFLGAISFSDHFNILTGRFRALRDSVELKGQIVILLAALALGFSVWMRDPGFQENFTPLQVLFHIVSAFATAGFQAGSIHDTNDSYKIILAVLSLIGGSAFSTAGGIKVLRILIAAKSIGIETSLITHPPGYVPKRRLGRYILDEDLVRRTLATISAFVGTYVLLVIVLAALYPGQYLLGDVVFEIASAMGNVGLSAGITAASAPVGAKLVLIAAMLLGRLEVVAYLVALRLLIR